MNYCALIAAMRCIEGHIKFPFHSLDLYKICEKQILRQSEMMRTANEVQQFFEMVAYLLSTKEIVEGTDIMIASDYVKIRLVTIFPLYRQYSRTQNMKALDKGTLTNYLKTSVSYCEKLSEKGSHRFTNINSPTNSLVFRHDEICRHYKLDFMELSLNADNQQVTTNNAS